MKKLFKKSLACCLAAVLSLTVFAGALAVSAETDTVTVTVKGTEVTVGATEAIVDVEIAATGAGAAAVAFELTSDLAITDVTAGDDFDVEYADGKIIVMSVDFTDAASANFTLANVSVKYDLTDVAAGEYTITPAALLADASSANFDEDPLAVSGVEGSIVVKDIPTHEHSYTYTDNGDGTHNGTCECGEDAITNEAHNYVDNVCDKCNAVKSIEDSAIPAAVTTRLTVSESISLSVIFRLPAAYDDFVLRINRQQVDGDYNLVPALEKVVLSSECNSAGTTYVYTYSGFGLYESSLDVNFTFDCYKGGVLTGTGTKVFNLAEALVNAAPTSAYKNLYSELLYLSDSALTYFKEKNPTKTIVNVPSPLNGHSIAKIDTYTDIADNSSFIGKEPIYRLNVLQNPTLAYVFTGLNADVVANGSLKSVYHSDIGNGDVVVESTLSAPINGVAVIGTNASFTHGSVKLYDLDRVITTQILDGSSNVVIESQTSLAMRICAALRNPGSDATYNELLKRVVIFAEAAKADLS